jgi:tripartite-type tricarboxylate transporter receptor subunit TctC
MLTIRLLGIASLGLLCASHAGAQAPIYPLKPITVLVGIGAGSNTDVLARIAAKRLSERLKQPVLVENRPGAGGTIAAATVAGAPADGYTLLWASSSIPLFPHMYQNLKFDPIKDLIGVGGVAEGGLVMLTRSNAPWKSLADLIAYGKSKPKGTIIYASAGIGSNAYLFSELFAQSAGLEFVHVPYKGSSAALTDVMAGQVDFVFDGPSTAIPQVKSGRVSAIAFSTKNRSAFMPDIPTMNEAGAKGFAQRTWLGFFAPVGIPKAVVQRLSDEIQGFVVEPSFRNELAAASHEPMKMSSTDFSSMVSKESDEWAVRLKTIKLE